MRFGRLITLFAVLAPLALAGPAPAQEFQRIYQDYKDDGQLDSCYNAYELHNAGQQIPPDLEQYDPGFGDALRAGGSGCANGQRQAPEEAAPAPVSAGTPGPGTPASARKKTVKEPPTPKKVPQPVLADLPEPDLDAATAGVSSAPPGGLIVLLVAAAAALAIALAWAIAWFMGWSPERFTRPLSAAFENLFQRH